MFIWFQDCTISFPVLKVEPQKPTYVFGFFRKSHLNRGFADSTRVTPNKVDVVNDSVKVYEYVKNLANETPIFIYGHSLGTAISVEVLAKLCGEGNKSLPTALILGEWVHLLLRIFK